MKREGLIILRSENRSEYDCEVYACRSSTLKGFVWCHVASYRHLGDAERAYPSATFFQGHGDNCDCVGPEDHDCLFCVDTERSEAAIV